MTLLDLFDAAVAQRGDALAIDAISYRELAAATLRIARRLRERGLEPGDRIGSIARIVRRSSTCTWPRYAWARLRSRQTCCSARRISRTCSAMPKSTVFPGVRASAVVGAPDAARGESVVAFIERSAALDDGQLIEWLRTRLASFEILSA